MGSPGKPRAKQGPSPEDAPIDPKALLRWQPDRGETLPAAVVAVVPKIFLPGPAPRALHTAEVQWLCVAERICAIYAQFRERRRFILHWPRQAPFKVALMFDIADPVKAAPIGLDGVVAGAPLLAVRYRCHDPAWGQEEAKAAVVDFYRRQRDGFLNAEAAVVPPNESIVGLEAPSREAVEFAQKAFEKHGARLARDYAKLFEDSPLKPSFIVPAAPDLSTLCVGAHVELTNMKTAGYDGIQGHVLARAEGMPDRWAVMPRGDAMRARAVALRPDAVPETEPLRPLAIKDASLKVVDEPEPSDDEIEDAD